MFTNISHALSIFSRFIYLGVYFSIVGVLLNLIYLFSWGRWNEINEQGQFKRGWAITDIEDCARVIVSTAVAFPIYFNHFNDDYHANSEKT